MKDFICAAAKGECGTGEHLVNALSGLYSTVIDRGHGGAQDDSGLKGLISLREAPEHRPVRKDCRNRNACRSDDVSV